MSFNLDDTLDEVINTTAFDENAVDDQGGGVNAAGFYHFEVKEVTREAKAGKTPCLLFKLEVLDGVTSDGKKGKASGQVGKVLFHRQFTEGKNGAPLSDGAQKIKLRFAHGLGLIKREEIGKPDLVIPWSRSRGVQGVMQVTEDNDPQYGKQYRISFGKVWPVNHPDVKDVPKSQEALAAIGLAPVGAPAAAAPTTFANL